MSNKKLLGTFNEGKEIEWEIPSLRTLSFDDTDYYESPSFAFANTSWNLRIYPTTNSNSRTLFLYLHNESGGTYDATCSLSIKEMGGTLFGARTVDRIGAGLVYVFFKNPPQLQLSTAEHMVVDIALRLNSGEAKTLPVPRNISFVEINSTPQERHCTREKPAVCKQIFRTMNRMDLHTLSKDLENLLDNEESCDTTLYVKNKVLKAHRAVLIARSPVFAAMFEHDTLEKRTGIINISDTDPDSFEQFLEYLYTGHVEQIPYSSVFHLYYTSDKYDVQTLKTFCADYLMLYLTVENYWDIVYFADMNNEAKLLSAAHDFFNRHREQLSSAKFGDLLSKDCSSALTRKDWIPS